MKFEIKRTSGCVIDDHECITKTVAHFGGYENVEYTASFESGDDFFRFCDDLDEPVIVLRRKRDNKMVIEIYDDWRE